MKKIFEKPVKKHFYLNPIARLFLLSLEFIRVLIAGRGFGKSFINGISVLQKVYYLPRSKGLFIGETYTAILTNTILPMKSAWEWFGYYEGIHYVIGKKPPKHFTRSYQEPERYENVVSWWCGVRIIFGSFDRPQLLRGGNYDWVITDEALRIKKDIYDEVVSPAIRGSHPVFRDHPHWLMHQFTSSMPYGTMGQWLLDYEIKAKNPDNSVFYIEGTTWHNRKVLGDQAIKNMVKDMSPLKYAVEIMNKRIAQIGNKFYPSLRDRHWYDMIDEDTSAYNYTFIDKLGYDIDSKNKDSRWDNDYDPNLPIHISHDWGSFNCITVDQYHRPIHTVRFLNYMWIEHPQIIDDLAAKFCHYYRHHNKKHKTVYQWGDKSGIKKEANAKLTYFEQFASILRRHGWTVIRKKVGDISHLERHNFISILHRESDGRLPKIRHNLNNCKDLKIALESTAMKKDKKDKSSEGNPSIKQQYATHGTDAYDYRLFHAFYGLYKNIDTYGDVMVGG